MKSCKIALTLCLLSTFAPLTIAQSPRRRPTPRPAPKAPVSQPTPEPAVVQPFQPLVPKARIPLAIVNGQTISTSDIDPNVAEAVEGLDDKLAAARQQVLEIQINTLLLEAEAQKRHVRTQQLYEQEVMKHIVDPSETEIAKFTEQNRSELNDSDPKAARAQVIAFLRSEQEQTISADFVRRLRSAFPVTSGPSLSTPGLAPSTVIATVAGRPITAGLMTERMKPIDYRLRLQSYDLAKETLEQTITDMLLLAEANSRNIPPEQIVKTEVTDKLSAPSESEVTKFYEENKTKLEGDTSSVRAQIATYLQAQKREQLEQALAQRLRKGVDIRYLLKEPKPPVQAISADDDPARGDANAPVTIVEFTDFQCPACAAMFPVLETVLKSYGNKVRFVIRDFPLSMHANARKAAEAADAANAQGKFFEYASLLFQRQKALDVPSLKKYATEVGLDRARFDAALDKGTYAEEIRHDMDEGEIYGVVSTPTIFINGVMLRSLSEDALRESIDHALALSSQKASQ